MKKSVKYFLKRLMQMIMNKLEETIMKVTVCIGSSCHLKGSRQIVEQLQSLTVDEEFHSVTPETVSEFFNEQILGKLK